MYQCKSNVRHLVAPFVGAWIEIVIALSHNQTGMSLPLWERGLKCNMEKCRIQREKVAPFVGAWIEIGKPVEFFNALPVAPFVGAWIEIAAAAFSVGGETGRSLCGSVD